MGGGRGRLTAVSSWRFSFVHLPKARFLAGGVGGGGDIL